MEETQTALPELSSLTFLFTDLEGSTRLWQEHPEAMKSALERHDELVRQAVEGAGGNVVKTTGDGFHAVFQTPADGIRACFRAQQGLGDEKWGETGALRVRMGLHFGEAQRRGGDYYGTSVNRAARLMSAAHGGQVLLSAALANMIFDHLPEGMSLLDLGEHRLKDLQRPEHIFQLLHPGLLADFPAIASLNRRPNNLPSQPTVFVGRQTELEEISRMLGDNSVRLLTLTGPGGTGKTRLALQAGVELIDRFTDGMYFIDLAPIRDPNDVLAAIARTAGLQESSNGSMLQGLKDQLRDKTTLLLLDNFEQVTSAAAQIAELLQFCPRLKLLATSREALRVRGEFLYPVPPLGLPRADSRLPKLEELAQYEAIQLFVDRAQAVVPNFELSEENAGTIADICRRLDGLPLAIELAAARVRIFSPQTLQQRLGSRFKVLSGGARDLPERQQTLRDAIGWSYDLLDTPEKWLFQVFSVFSGGTLDDVERVATSVDRLAESEMDITEGLFSLVDKSLVRLSEDGQGEARLQMLESIRAYAAEGLASDPDLHDDACRAHAQYFAEFAHRQWNRMAGVDREEATASMAANVENLRIAWRHWVSEGDMTHLQQMVDGLWLLYDRRGWYQATIELATDLLDTLSLRPSSPEQARQEIMLQTSLARALLAIKGYTPEVEAAYNRALQLSEGQGEIPQLFPVLRGLSSYYMYRAEFDKGLQIGNKLMELAESSDDNYLRVHACLVLGANTGFFDGYLEGLKILDEGIALVEKEPHALRPFQLGNNPGVVCYTTSSFFLWWLGRLSQALERAEKALVLAEELKHPFSMAYALFHTANLFMMRGDLARPKKQAQAMMEIAEQHGFQIWQSLGRMLYGSVLAAGGHAEEGLPMIEQGFEQYQGLKTPPVFFPQLIGMRSIAYAQAGRPGKGLQLLDDFLDTMEGESTLRLQLPLLMIKGDLMLATSTEDLDEVLGIYGKILAVAEESEGLLFALQAATRLCQIGVKMGDAEDSGRTLAALYSRFEVGFDSADLQAAKEVLEAWKNS